MTKQYHSDFSLHKARSKLVPQEENPIALYVQIQDVLLKILISVHHNIIKRVSFTLFLLNCETCSKAKNMKYAIVTSTQSK